MDFEPFSGETEEQFIARIGTDKTPHLVYNIEK